MQRREYAPKPRKPFTLWKCTQWPLALLGRESGSGSLVQVKSGDMKERGNGGCRETKRKSMSNKERRGEYKRGEGVGEKG